MTKQAINYPAIDGKNSFYGRPSIVPQDQAVTFAQLVEDVPICSLKNTPDDAFWYTSNTFKTRFDHEMARVGSRFVDGNNGDRWRVIAANTERRRLIVQNLTQGGVKLVWWE